MMLYLGVCQGLFDLGCLIGHSIVSTPSSVTARRPRTRATRSSAISDTSSCGMAARFRAAVPLLAPKRHKMGSPIPGRPRGTALARTPTPYKATKESGSNGGPFTLFSHSTGILRPMWDHDGTQTGLRLDAQTERGTW